jgi:drug/metabolite transporter (DMT)-like permease
MKTPSTALFSACPYGYHKLATVGEPIMVILAEEFSPLLGVLFLAPIILAVACRLAIVALRRMRGQKPLWGLALGVLAILSGVAELLMLLTTRGGAPSFFYLIAALPIITGLHCLLIWNQRPRPRT